MNILYCGDQHMRDGLIISILSLTKHHTEPLHIYILTATITTPDRTYWPIEDRVIAKLNVLVQRENPSSTVVKIDITRQFQTEFPTANLNTIFTPNCMLRLYADQVPVLPNRILYLDTDVICRQNCQAFYQQPLEHVEFVGVLDHYGQWLFKERFAHLSYLNSGVLLLNLRQIRESGLFADCRYLCRVQRMFMPDQSALNKLAFTKRIAPRRFNEQRRLHADTVFQHFTTSFRIFPWIHTLTVKPWQVDQMHRKLKLHEYDDLLSQYQQIVASLA